MRIALPRRFPFRFLGLTALLCVPAVLFGTPLDAMAWKRLPGLKQALAHARQGKELTAGDRVAVREAMDDGNSILVALAACVLRDDPGDETDLRAGATKAAARATGVGGAFLRLLAVRHAGGGPAALRALLEDENPYLQVEAAKELCRLSPEQGKAALSELLSSRSPSARCEVRRQLERLGQAGGKPTSPMPEEQYRLLLSILAETGRSWGPVTAGFRLQGHAEMPVCRSGEPVVVSVTLRNVSDDAGRYVLSNEWADHTFVVKDAHGKAVSLTPEGRRRADNVEALMRMVKPLRPRGEFEAKIVLSRLFDLTRGGVYTVTVERRVLGTDGFALVSSNPFLIRIQQ